jgi:hypothetical protein
MFSYDFVEVKVTLRAYVPAGPADYLAELPPLADAISNAAIAVTANTLPLADVEEAWTREEAPGERTVLVP